MLAQQWWLVHFLWIMFVENLRYMLVVTFITSWHRIWNLLSDYLGLWFVWSMAYHFIQVITRFKSKVPSKSYSRKIQIFRDVNLEGSLAFLEHNLHTPFILKKVSSLQKDPNYKLTYKISSFDLQLTFVNYWFLIKQLTKTNLPRTLVYLLIHLRGTSLPVLLSLQASKTSSRVWIHALSNPHVLPNLHG